MLHYFNYSSINTFLLKASVMLKSSAAALSNSCTLHAVVNSCDVFL